jgi:hypothetical protein
MMTEWTPNSTPILGGLNITTDKYLSESEVRRRVSEALKGKSADLRALVALADEERELVVKASKLKQPGEHDKMLERWVEKILINLRRRGRLMTERQYDDFLKGMRLQEGSWCRYIGPDREETTLSGQVILRAHGQRGVITRVDTEKGARILTFHPHEAVVPIFPPTDAAQFVDLQVKEYTTGWLALEREEHS